MPYGVGIIGAGPGVAALHLPTLGRLPDTFEVVHISDGGSGRATGLAAPIGAASSTGIRDLVADPRVDVVAVCSPPAQHAAHILAALEGGARGILCEKPLATDPDQARVVIDACRDAGAALVVGTNHLYDPAWARAKHHLLALGARVTAVTLTLSLPPNGRYHALVTDHDTQPAVRPMPAVPPAEVQAGIVRQLISGLLVHDLPLVRDLVPHVGALDDARFVAPLGCLVAYDGAGVPVRLAAVMRPDGAEVHWRLTVATTHDRIDVDFPPPFVHTGSAAVTVRSPDGTVTRYPRSARDGYEAEWRALAQQLDGTAVTEYDEPLADARYALTIADAAFALLASRADIRGGVA